MCSPSEGVQSNEVRDLSGNNVKFRKSGAYIFQRPFLRGLFVEGLKYGGKFAIRNRLGKLIVGRQIKKMCYRTVFALFHFVFEGNFQV